jgi:hypothetical protein
MKILETKYERIFIYMRYFSFSFLGKIKQKNLYKNKKISADGDI